jgi:hypothetical protein
MTNDDMTRISNQVAKRIEKDTKRDVIWRSIFFAAALAFISAALLIGFIALVNTTFDFRDKLDAKDHVDAVTQNRTECRNSFNVHITDTKGTFDVAFADALLIGVTPGHTPDQLTNATNALVTARDEYNKAVAARLQYEKQGAPLPCPIAVSVPANPAANPANPND